MQKGEIFVFAEWFFCPRAKKPARRIRRMAVLLPLVVNKIAIRKIIITPPLAQMPKIIIHTLRARGKEVMQMVALLPMGNKATLRTTPTCGDVFFALGQKTHLRKFVILPSCTNALKFATYLTCKRGQGVFINKLIFHNCINKQLNI